jgi:glyoxylase I family protein
MATYRSAELPNSAGSRCSFVESDTGLIPSHAPWAAADRRIQSCARIGRVPPRQDKADRRQKPESVAVPLTVYEFMRLAHLMVFVPDLDRARAFYDGVLGFPVTRRALDHVVFGSPGVELVAFRCDTDGMVESYSREARAVFVFGVPSVAKAMETLRSQGVEFLHETPAEGPTGRYAAFVDPFGIVHEILEQRHPLPPHTFEPSPVVSTDDVPQ